MVMGPIFTVSTSSSAADQLELAKQIIQAQSNLMGFGMAAVIGVAALLLVATWIYNLVIHKREISALRESIEAKVSSGVNERLQAEIKKVEDDLRQKSKRTILTFEAEKARIFGIITRNAHDYQTSAHWWAIAAKYFTMLDVPVLVRASIVSVWDALKHCESLQKGVGDEIAKILPVLPEILSLEKEKIAKQLQELPKENPPASAPPIGT